MVSLARHHHLKLETCNEIQPHIIKHDFENAEYIHSQRKQLLT